MFPPGKIQPVLLPKFVLNSAFHFAPPVALLSWIAKYCALTVPEAFDRVNCDPGVVLLMVTKLPAVPARLKLGTVCVVPAVKVTVDGCEESVMSLKVLLPLMVSVPAPPWLRL